jgi:nucleoside 2-deoxyribosyltransferase
MRLYLAGTMTGIPQFNFPLFEYWSGRLRNAGFDVLSPHNSDDPDVQKAAWASEAGDPSDLPPAKGGSDKKLTILKNTEDILGCDGIALIENWQRSSGAVHEIAIATRLGIPVAPVEMWYFCGPLIEKHLS